MFQHCQSDGRKWAKSYTPGVGIFTKRYFFDSINAIMEHFVSVVFLFVKSTAFVNAYFLLLPQLQQQIINLFYTIPPETFTKMTAQKNKKEKNVSPPQRDYSFAGILERIIEEKKLYLKADLCIADLAAQLSTNRTYLSDYFGHVLHTSFYDYVNRMRIERACIPLMSEKNNLKLQAIAEESGFRSVTTFRRAFFKLTGRTPYSYMKELRQKLT